MHACPCSSSWLACWNSRVNHLTRVTESASNWQQSVKDNPAEFMLLEPEEVLNPIIAVSERLLKFSTLTVSRRASDWLHCKTMRADRSSTMCWPWQRASFRSTTNFDRPSCPLNTRFNSLSNVLLRSSDGLSYGAAADNVPRGKRCGPSGPSIGATCHRLIAGKHSIHFCFKRHSSTKSHSWFDLRELS